MVGLCVLIMLGSLLAFAGSLLFLAGGLPVGVTFPIKHPGWPLLLAVVCGLGMAIAWPGRTWRWVRRLQEGAGQFAVIWLRQGLVGKAIQIALVIHVLSGLGMIFNGPENIVHRYQERARLSRSPDRIFYGERVANFEFFMERWRQEIPERAQVAYQGHWEGLLAAYELYPRRLFFTPDSILRLASGWNDHRWLKIRTRGASAREDWTDEFWPPIVQDRFQVPVDLEGFLRERQISCLMRYDEGNPEACRVELQPTGEMARTVHGQ